MDFGKGDASFCLGTVRNADDPLHTEPIASAVEKSVVIVCCLSRFSSLPLFFFPPLFLKYTFVHLFLIHCPDFSSISPFPALPSSPSPLPTGGPSPAHSQAQRWEGLGGLPAAGPRGAGLGRIGKGEGMLAAMRAARRTPSRP